MPPEPTSNRAPGGRLEACTDADIPRPSVAETVKASRTPALASCLAGSVRTGVEEGNRMTVSCALLVPNPACTVTDSCSAAGAAEASKVKLDWPERVVIEVGTRKFRLLLAISRTTDSEF